MAPTPDDIDRELEFHLQALAADLEGEGADRADAIRKARLQFGGSLQIREACVDSRQRRWLSEIRLDLRGAVRALLRAPAFSISFAVVVMLAIGPALALFNVAERVLVGGMDVPDQRSVVEFNCRRDGEYCAWSFSDLSTLQQLQSSVDLFAVGSIPSEVAVFSNGQRHLAPAMLTSANAFDTLRIHPYRGRLFVATDDQPGAPVVALVSFTFWRDVLGADPAAIGRHVDVNGHAVTVVGVTPRGWKGFSLELEPAITLPLSAANEFRARGILNKQIGWLQILGRLKQGESLQTVQTTVPARWRDRQNASAARGSNVSAYSLEIRRAEDGAYSPLSATLAPSLRLLTAAAILMLLNCAVNLCGISTSRVAARAREFALRRVLGAGFASITRRIFLEVSVVTLIGGALGVAVGHGIVLLIRDVAMRSDPIVELVRVSWDTAAAVTLALTLATVAGSSALTAALAVGRDRAGWLSQSRITDSGGRVRHFLLVVQVSIAVAVSIAGLSSLRGLLAIEHQSLGFDVDHMVVATIDPGVVGYSPEQSRAYIDRAIDTLAAYQGVTSISMTAVVPGEGSIGANPVAIAGFDGPRQRTAINRVGAKYFATIGARVLLGRELDRNDDVTSGSVVINRELARTIFGDRDLTAVVGAKIAITGVTPPALTVVGVVDTLKDFGAARPAQPVAYLPLEDPPRALAIVARIEHDPAAFAPVLRHLLTITDANVPVRSVLTPRAYKQKQFGRARIVATSVVAISIVGMAIVSVAIFAMVNLALQHVSKEMAIKRALGASGTTVTFAIGKEMLVCVATGIVLGFGAVAWQWPRASSLMDLPPFDSGNGVIAAATVVLVTATAMWRPTRAVLSTQFARMLND